MNNLGKNFSEEQVIVFLHIPKTAGTTFRYIIQYQYKPTAIYELYNHSLTHSQRLDKLLNLSETRKQQIKIVNSHFGFGLHEFLHRPYTYITFLRAPIDRVVSMYYYLQRTNNIQTNPLPPDLSLKDFVQTYQRIQNGMTKYLSGVILKDQLADQSPKSTANSQCATKADLELAKKNLKEHFKVIGLAERFDESLILFQKTLGWKIPLYDKNNVSKSRPSTRNVSKDTLRLIEKSNEFDIQLYEYAKEVFEEYINQQGASFEREVEKFKEANKSSKVKLYFRLRTFYNRVVHRTYQELVK